MTKREVGTFLLGCFCGLIPLLAIAAWTWPLPWLFVLVFLNYLTTGRSGLN